MALPRPENAKYDRDHDAVSFTVDGIRCSITKACYEKNFGPCGNPRENVGDCRRLERQIGDLSMLTQRARARIARGDLEPILFTTSDF
jgi:hypothetical protein